MCISRKELSSPFVLAPLAGVSDSAFRRICHDMGAALSYTEMISVKGLYYRNDKTSELLAISPEEGPVGVQLFGSDPEAFSYSIDTLAGIPFALTDINMGCPVPKVVKSGDGSALLKNPNLAAEIVRTCVEASKRVAKATGGERKPVTVKMRVGFSEKPSPGELDCADFARLMEDSGAAAITVHGRVRDQYYSGKADRLKIKRVKEAVSVPVIGNGDVFSAEDGLRMLDETGCDFVMVARGALGNPWIFRELLAAWKGLPAPPRPDAGERIETIKRHIVLATELKGEYAAVREMRKHISWYTKGLRGAATLRDKVNKSLSLDELLAAVEEIRDYR